MSIRAPESHLDRSLLRLQMTLTVRSLNWVLCFVRDAAVCSVSALPSKAVSEAAVAAFDAVYVLLGVVVHVGLLLETVVAAVSLH